MSIVLSYLNQNKKWDNDADIKHVVDDLNNNENRVTTLHFTGNTMGIKAAEELTIPLSKQSKLDKILWSDMFTGRGKDQIGAALKALTLGLMKAQVHLVELDLSDNAFGPNGVIGCTDLIASPCCYTLKVLNMNNQGLGHQGCKCLVDAMKTARLNSNKQGLNLEVFIAGRNRLENEGMKMLSEVFGDGMNSLKKLVLLQNGVGIYGIKGVESLIVAIRNHKNLRILNISDNTIKSNGMKLLTDVIPEFEKLEELYMDDCLLGSKGVDIFSLLAEDRSVCTDLKIISLSGNEMKGRAATNLINGVLEGKPSLEKIDLRENEIKSQTVVEMLHILSKFDKEDILVREEVTSDDEECSDDSTEESEGSEAGSIDGESEEEYENGEESCDEENSYEENVDEDASEVTLDDLSINNTNGMDSKVSSNIFTFPTTNNISGNVCKPTGLFSTGKETSNSFGSVSASSNPFNARTNIFSTASTQSNIFTKDEGSPIKTNVNNLFAQKLETAAPTAARSIFGTSTFSFSEAAKPVAIPKFLKDGIVSCLKSCTLMSIDRLTLNANKTTEISAVVDAEIKKGLQCNPENGVRVGFILCEDNKTYDFGLAIIGYLLTSQDLCSRATNAVLVEMNCLKSEEKHFVPLCKKCPDVPAKVLKQLLSTSQLSEKVKTSLSIVIKTFTKVSNKETENLLAELDNVMNKLTI